VNASAAKWRRASIAYTAGINFDAENLLPGPLCGVMDQRSGALQPELALYVFTMCLNRFKA